MILLDTHVWLWLSADPKKLSKPATHAIRQAVRDGGLAVSSISLLELAWLYANGKAQASDTLLQAVQGTVDRSRVEVLQVSPEVAATAVQLPPSVPKDPADRLIVATALVHGLPLVTRDGRILDSGACNTIW